MPIPPPDSEPLVEAPHGGGAAHRVVAVETEALRLAALQRLVGGPRTAGSRVGATAPRHQAERFLQFSRQHTIPVDAMWAALDADEAVIATVLAIPNPGRTAIIFASLPDGVSEVSTVATVVDHACAVLGTNATQLAQVLLEPHDTLLRGAFTSAGFQELAYLSYMERALPRRGRGPRVRWPEGVRVEPYTERHRDDLLQVLEASYEDTRDCPGLRGLRQTEDILAGHRGTGTFAADLWTILYVDGAPRGTLLLNLAPASNTIELVYIGFARSAQGRGLGRMLLRYGLGLVAGRPERAMTLAVDEGNEPAIALYRGEGFRRVLRRLALIRALHEDAGEPRSGASA